MPIRPFCQPNHPIESPRAKLPPVKLAPKPVYTFSYLPFSALYNYHTLNPTQPTRAHLQSPLPTEPATISTPQQPLQHHFYSPPQPTSSSNQTSRLQHLHILSISQTLPSNHNQAQPQTLETIIQSKKRQLGKDGGLPHRAQGTHDSLISAGTGRFE